MTPEENKILLYINVRNRRPRNYSDHQSEPYICEHMDDEIPWIFLTNAHHMVRTLVSPNDAASSSPASKTRSPKPKSKAKKGTGVGRKK